MSRARLSSLIASALLMAACGRTSPEDWSVAITPLAAPAGANSAQPQVTTSSKGALLSWIEMNGAAATLKFAERTSGGWSEARSIASGNDWFISDADPPMVIRLSDGTLVGNWYQTTDIRLEAYNLWLSYSRDEGRTWAPAFAPHHDGTTTQHGFASLFELPEKGLGLVWLDAREWELSRDSPDGGAVMLRFASFDPQWKQTVDETVNLRVCDCCQTSVAVTADGVLTAFRDRSDKEIRDIRVARRENGKWSDALPVHDDGWENDSCPVNGPAVSARGRTAVAAWFTVKGDQGQTLLAFSQDAGHTWGAPARLDSGQSRGQVDVELLDDGSAVATWVDVADGRSRLRMRRVEPSGMMSGTVEVDAGGAGRVSGYPHIARTGDELVVTWTESSGGVNAVQQVKTATARLP
jgi:hypothetical protein